jgi:transposase
MTYIKRNPVNEYKISCLDEVIGDENPVRLYRLLADKFVSANADKLGIRDKIAAGRPEYHPSDIFCLFLYGYVNRIGSSRRLEKACYNNKEVEWLMGYLRPDHWTINKFRKDHLKLIDGFLRQFRKFMKAQKLIDGNYVMVDGTKIKANNSRDMLKVEELVEVINRSEEDISRYLERLDRLDSIEEEQERLAEIRREREEFEQQTKLEKEQLQQELESERERLRKEMEEEKERVRRELEELKAKTEKYKKLHNKAVAEDIKYIGPTDLDSRLMLTRNGKTASYNSQTAVDSKNHLIVGVTVTNDPVDVNQLRPMVNELLSEGIPVERVVADKGYSSLNEIQQIEEETSVECIVPIKKVPNEEKDLGFTYDEEKDEYICPMGKRLTLLQKGNKSRKDNASVYLCRECDGCSIRKSCTNSGLIQ